MLLETQEWKHTFIYYTHLQTLSDDNNSAATVHLLSNNTWHSGFNERALSNIASFFSKIQFLFDKVLEP